MGDLISREKALALVMSVCVDLIMNCGSHYDEELSEEVFDDIKELDAILKCAKGIRTGIRELPDEQKWVPISDGLPEERISEISRDFEYVLCTMTSGDVRAYRFGTIVGENEPHFLGGFEGRMDDRVVAWMYLPDGYVPIEEGRTEE